MLEAYARTSAYDAAIVGHSQQAKGASQFPQNLSLQFTKSQELRYGENPHQKAAVLCEGRLEGLLACVSAAACRQAAFIQQFAGCQFHAAPHARLALQSGDSNTEAQQPVRRSLWQEPEGEL